MPRDEVEEFYSEDLGFRLLVGKLGMLLFDHPVDFKRPHTFGNPLQLLHVGHTKQLYAASNTQYVGVGKLSDLDSEESVIKKNFKAVALANVTCVRFNSNNEKVYVLANGLPQAASVADILSGSSASPFSAVSPATNIQMLEPSLLVPETYCYLDSTQTLHINDRGAEAQSAGIDAFTWAYSGTEIVAVSGSTLMFLSLSGAETTSYDVVDAGKLVSVSSIDNDNWYIVGKPENGDPDDVHTLVTKNGRSFTSKKLLLAPAFSEISRFPSTYFASIVDWTAGSSLAFTTGGLSTEISVIECGKHERLVAQLNDTDRAELPMDDSGEDTLPVGFALDLSGTSRVVKNPSSLIEEAVGVLPRLMCLNSQAHLYVWNVFDAFGVRENKLDLNRALARLPAATQNAENAENAPSGSITLDSFAKTLDTKPLSAGGLVSTFPPQPNAAALGFGATSFGSGHPAGKPMFPSSNFNAGGLEVAHAETPKPAFGSSGFGTTSSSTGPAFGRTGFGSASSSASAPDAGSVFGQASFDKQKSESAFGNVPSSSRTTQASEFSGFGAKSKFGAASFQKTQSNTSSFAVLAKNEDTASPFASLMKNDKLSPFGTLDTPDSASIFGATKASTTSSASPFALLKPDEKASPFATLNADTKASLLGASTTKNASSPFGAPLSGSLFLTGPNQFSSAGRGFDLDSSQNLETSSESPSESGGEYQEHHMFANVNIKPLNINIGRTDRISNIDDVLSLVDTDRSLPHDLYKKANISTAVLFKTSTKASEEAKPDKAKHPRLLELAIAKKVSYEGKDIAEIVKNTQFLNLGGFTEEPKSSKDEVSRKFMELVQVAQGNLDVLALNTEKASSLIEAASTHSKSLAEQEDLGDPKLWSLGDLDDLLQVTKTPREGLAEILMAVRHQNSKLSTLLTRVDESESKKEDLEKVVTQLALFKQSLDAAKLSKRPLDVRAEMLRHQLRKKLAHVELLQEEIAQQLLPFGVLLDFGESSVARVNKLEKVVHELSMKAREVSQHVEALESDVYKYCDMPRIEDTHKQGVHLAICPPKVLIRDKFELAQKYINGTRPRKIMPLAI